MLWLTLMRHAKSDWTDDTLRDFDRPLNTRGEKSAPLMGRHLKALWSRPGSPLEGVPPPDHVLVSPAVRTRLTYERTKSTWPGLPAAEWTPSLYDAGADDILAVIKKAPATARHVIVIGHNDGLAELANDMLKAPPPRDIASDLSKFPTAAVAIMSLPQTSWPRVALNTATLLHFMTPKRLIALKT
ncbi:MAG: hypothetical protein RL291_1774 [Pseudomonadota bacterium]|jgi:phosphohistidine phosphatase